MGVTFGFLVKGQVSWAVYPVVRSDGLRFCHVFAYLYIYRYILLFLTHLQCGHLILFLVTLKDFWVMQTFFIHHSTDTSGCFHFHFGFLAENLHSPASQFCIFSEVSAPCHLFSLHVGWFHPAVAGVPLTQGPCPPLGFLQGQFA